MPPRGSRVELALLGLLAALAMIVRLLPVLRGGGLYGVFTYDDGVYFGAALALVHGRIPYRDFLLLHPPGILYILAPIAALGSALGDAGAFAVARLAFMALGAANAMLVALVARPLGRRAALLAGAMYVVWEVAANVERTTWLIAPQNTLLLLALLVLARSRRTATGLAPSTRRSALAGGLLGLSLGTQLWGVVTIAVVLAWLIPTTRRQAGGWRRPVVAYLVAAGLAVGIVWLPFLLTSGGEMIRYVVVDQLGRPPMRGSVGARLRAMEGVPDAGAVGRIIPGIVVELAFLAAAVTVGWAAWRRPAIRLWATLLAAQAAVLLVVPPFVHYAGWLAPAGALAIGGATDTIFGRLRPGGRPSRVLGAAYALLLVLLLAISVGHSVGKHLAVARLEPLLAGARCVTADSPVLLIETGAIGRDLHAGCPLKLDPTGTSYDTDHGSHATRRNRTEYQLAMAEYYGGSDAALFIRLPGDALRADTWASIGRRLPVATVVGPVTVLARSGP